MRLREDELWCANAPSTRIPAFYLLSGAHPPWPDDRTEGEGGGTVNGQPKRWLIRGVQFKGEIRRLSGDEEARMRQRPVKRFPVAPCCRRRYGKIRPDEIKFTDNTLGFGKKLLAA